MTYFLDQIIYYVEDFELHKYENLFNYSQRLGSR